MAEQQSSKSGSSGSAYFNNASFSKLNQQYPSNPHPALYKSALKHNYNTNVPFKPNHHLPPLNFQGKAAFFQKSDDAESQCSDAQLTTT